MERLSLLDAEFLHLEDARSPMHIASISILEDPLPSSAAVTRMFEAKLHLAPRYRQRVRPVPLALGRPVWVDDPSFRLEYHVRRTALPAPGDDAALCLLMGRLMAQPLDRERPLWEAWFVDGLEHGRWALILKVHHCMVDGIAGIDLMSALLDGERDVEAGDPVPWTPRPEPDAAAKVLDAWSGLAHDAHHWGNRLWQGLRQPRMTVRTALGLGVGLATFARQLLPQRSPAPEGTVGAHRVYAHGTVQLADVARVRQAFGGTVNDVVLAAATHGYRMLFQHRGQAPRRLRALIPVSVRKGEQATVDNRVSAILCDLPVQLVEPTERLRAVQARIRALKASHMAEAGEWVTEVGNLAPPMLVGPITQLVASAMHRFPQRSIHSVITNVPGPRTPLYCSGCRVLEILPYVPITQGVQMGLAVLSYAGQLSVGVTGDYDRARDVDVLARGIEEGMRELLACAGKLDSAAARPGGECARPDSP
jgi:WS/DGAT/MGAT family acyltransferase